MNARMILGGTIIFAAGIFGIFVLCVFSYRHDCDGCFDNMAVLTGEHDRIAYAFSLAESCKVQNIFISGVYEKTILKDIMPKKPIPNVRVILGKQAKNTEQNAKEIDEWVRRNNISEILLVTSDYHMMRSVAELRHVNDKLRIHTCAVSSPLNFAFFLRCFKEFHKMIYIRCRNLLEKIRIVCCS